MKIRLTDLANKLVYFCGFQLQAQTSSASKTTVSAAISTAITAAAASDASTSSSTASATLTTTTAAGEGAGLASPTITAAMQQNYFQLLQQMSQLQQLQQQGSCVCVLVRAKGIEGAMLIKEVCSGWISVCSVRKGKAQDM